MISHSPPPATAAPTNEKALNSPLEEDEVACKEGAVETPEAEDGMVLEGEGVKTSQGSVATDKEGLVENDLEEDIVAKRRQQDVTITKVKITNEAAASS